MQIKHKSPVPVLLVFVLNVILLAACNYPGPAIEATAPLPESITPESTPDIAEVSKKPDSITICLPSEPASLFLYGDISASARSIRQAIYDGPIDINHYETVPVILESMPTIENGGVRFEPVTVSPGDPLVDANGATANLSEGTSYLPAGCPYFSCASVYSGQEPAQLDQQIVRFTMKNGLFWQDGEPLKAEDSQFSYETAKSLYPQVGAELINRTYSYQAVDERTIEWRGVPGFRYSGYAAAFFTPLPKHAWNSISAQEMFTAEMSSRKPIGWGPYTIEDWVAGDHITLNRNPSYFRQSEGLPQFEHLVFRFIANPQDALKTLKEGGCDYLGKGYDLEPLMPEVYSGQESGSFILSEKTSDAWEHIDFGINTLSAGDPTVVQAREVRQAVAYCSDRQKIADQLFQGKSLVPDSYVSPVHPLANPNVRKFPFDPGEGSRLLEAAGWIDVDGNAATPRSAQGVNGVADGTTLELEIVVEENQNNQLISSILKESLAQCGIGLITKMLPSEQLLASGSGSPVFGRNFTMAQYGWVGSWQPVCSLYTSQEIPGPYPQYSKGWGGSNPSGYNSLDFDRACQRALTTMPADPGFQAAHFLAQSIFTEDLPSLPLFLYPERVVHRSGLCGADLDTSAESPLWNIESFYFGDNCGE